MIRHGESEWNAVQRWQGWEDVPLTATGEAQALARARSLAAPQARRFAAVFASDLTRAARTAELIAGYLGLDPPAIDAGLRERHGGDWQGLTRDEIEEGWPGMREAWRRGEAHSPPGGEGDASVLERVDQAIARLCALVDEGASALVVTHHGVLRLVSTRAGVPPATLIPNLGGRWFTWNGEELYPGEVLGALPDPLDETPATE